MKSSPDERVGWLMHHRLSPRAGPAHFGNPGQRAVAAESLPVGGEGLAAHGVLQIGRSVGQRREYVGVFKYFITRQNQPIKLSDPIVVEKYVDVETAVGKLGLAAVAAVRVFQIGEPLLELHRRQVGADARRTVEEILAGKADRRRDRKSTRLNSSHVAISYAVF